MDNDIFRGIINLICFVFLISVIVFFCGMLGEMETVISMFTVTVFVISVFVVSAVLGGLAVFI